MDIKKQTISLTNGEIFSIAEKMIILFEQGDYIKTLPALVNFYIKKNYNIFYSLAMEIEIIRSQLVQKLTKENAEEIQSELNELSSAKQEVDINLIPLSSLNGYDLNYKEMDAIFFMIYEDEEKE